MDLSKLDKFFREHEHLFRQGDNSPTLPQYRTVDGKEAPRGIKLQMEASGLPIDFYLAKCFCVTKFLYYYLGGEDSGYLVKRTRQQPYAKGKDGDMINSVHWFLEHKDTGEILDGTSDQFIYGFKPDYEDSVGANLGIKNLIKRGGPKEMEYKDVVPSQEVRRLARAYREQYGSVGGLDVWLDAEKEWLNTQNDTFQIEGDKEI